MKYAVPVLIGGFIFASLETPEDLPPEVLLIAHIKAHTKDELDRCSM